MRTILLILSFVAACSPVLHVEHPATPNRVCILAAESQRVEGKDGTCEPATSDAATTDYAMWRTDGGVKWCHNTSDVEHPLSCFVFKFTATELARQQLAADRAKIEADAKESAAKEAAAKASSPAPSSPAPVPAPTSKAPR